MSDHIHSRFTGINLKAISKGIICTAILHSRYWACLYAAIAFTRSGGRSWSVVCRHKCFVQVLLLISHHSLLLCVLTARSAQPWGENECSHGEDVGLCCWGSDELGHKGRRKGPSAFPRCPAAETPAPPPKDDDNDDDDGDESGESPSPRLAQSNCTKLKRQILFRALF